MKRVMISLMVLCVLLGTGQIYAAFADTPHVAGGFQGWDAGSDPMTETSPGSGIWEAAFTGLDADTRYEFKITDGTWDSTHPSANSWLYTDASGEVAITFNTNTVSDGWDPTQYRLGLSTDPGNWTIVGDFQGWNNADPATEMIHQGGGIYKLSQSLTAGTYNWKPVVTSSWDSISWDARSINTANMELVLTEDSPVEFYVDAFNGTTKAVIVPEPATLMLLGFSSLFVLRSKK